MIEPIPIDPGELLFGDFQRQMQKEIDKAFALTAELLQTNSNATYPGPTTANEILAKMRVAEDALRVTGPRLSLIEDPIACLPGPPVRTYPKRRARSDHHWRRMNKKWLKRWGISWIPMAYQMDLGHEILIVVHPALAPEYRAAIDKHFPLRS